MTNHSPLSIFPVCLSPMIFSSFQCPTILVKESFSHYQFKKFVDNFLYVYDNLTFNDEYFPLSGTVGVPFPGVEVCIAKQNVYAENGYDIIAQGNSKRTRVTPGKGAISASLSIH